MNIFVYGTLRDEEVRQAVLGHEVARTIPAKLPDYAPLLVNGEAYPMIRPAQGNTAHGMILCDLPEADVDMLDRFEGDEYLRSAMVVFADDGTPHDVFIYQDLHGKPDDGIFDLEDWRQHLKDEFIETFMRRRNFDFNP